VTVHDALVERNKADLRLASDTLTAALPVGRAVTITPEALDAAAAGDVGMLATLFAQEIQPDAGDLAALAAADEEDVGTRAVLGDVRSELGLT
jgi:hypothetical protein